MHKFFILSLKFRISKYMMPMGRSFWKLSLIPLPMKRRDSFLPFPVSDMGFQTEILLH